jgi:hypothetical protein
MQRRSLDEIFAAQPSAPTSGRPSLNEIFSQPAIKADPLREFAAQDPDYIYGDILPIKKNRQTGEVSMAIPEALRAPLRGLADLQDIGANQSSEMTPDALAAFGTGIPLLKGVSKAGDILPTSDTVINAAKTAGKATLNTTKAATQPVIRKIIDETVLNKALDSDVAKEGMRLQEKLDIGLTAGELSGNPTIRGMEDALANSARWGGKFAEQNQKKTNAIIGRFQNELDKISPERMSRADVGDRLSSAYSSTIDNLIKTRRSQARIDFMGAGGKEETILSNNLFRELQAIKAEGDAKLLTGSKAHAGSLANKLLKRVSSKTGAGNEQADLISLDDMANGLSDFSSEARRAGGMLDNAKSAAERRVYARLYEALQKDLDAEIASPTANPERVASLVMARDNYKAFSGQIADLEKTTLGKLVGRAEADSNGELVLTPEKISDRLASMEATELKNTLKFLDTNHQDVANAARRYILESALTSAKSGVGQRGAGTTKEFAKAEFVKKLPDDETLNILFKDKQAAQNIRDIAAVVNRMIDYGASQKGSQTFQRGDFAKFWQGTKGLLFKSVIDDTLAEDLLKPATRRKMATEAKQMSRPLKVTITPRDKKAN